MRITKKENIPFENVNECRILYLSFRHIVAFVSCFSILDTTSYMDTVTLLHI